MEKEKKGRAIALLPIGVFLIIFLGAGIVFKDFYAMPAIVAFLIALFVAFLQNKELSFNKKIEVIAKGVGEENIRSETDLQLQNVPGSMTILN